MGAQGRALTWRCVLQSPYGLGPMARLSCDLRDVSWLYLGQGVALVLLGLLTVILPDLLTILVATFLVAIGLVTIVVGWRMRRARRAFDEISRMLLG